MAFRSTRREKVAFAAVLFILTFAVSSKISFASSSYFEKNLGQFSWPALYQIQTPAYAGYLTTSGITLAPNSSTNKHDVLNIEFVNAGDVQNLSRDPGYGESVRVLESAKSHANYYGSPANGKSLSRVPHAVRLLQKDLFDGVDVEYYFSRGALQYDIVLQEARKHRGIGVRFSGGTSVSIGDKGSLIVDNEGGDSWSQSAPVVYQRSESGDRIEISSRYRLISDNTVGFELDGKVDPGLPLVIDPIISFGAYVGTPFRDRIYDIGFDSNNNQIITGTTTSTIFPVTDDTESGAVLSASAADVFVSKFDTDGNLLWTTILDGSANELDSTLAVDRLHRVVVGGSIAISGSATFNFPVKDAVLPAVSIGTFSSSIAAFLLRLTPDGELDFSTFVGGSGGTTFMADVEVAVDHSIVATGWTNADFFFNRSRDFDGNDFGGTDAFLLKLHPNGRSVIFQNFIGGEETDLAYGLAIDNQGRYVLTGETRSPDFTLVNPLGPNTAFGRFPNENREVFLSRFSADGNRIEFSTTMGGPDFHDEGIGVVVDGNNVAYITGRAGPGFPLVRPAQPLYGGGQGTFSSDGFVAAVDIDNRSVLYSTFLGGPSNERGVDIALNEAGQVVVTGIAAEGFPQTENFPSLTGGSLDAFVAALNSDGSEIEYSGLIGGSMSDLVRAVAIDLNQQVVIVGETSSDDLSLIDSSQIFQGVQDGFIVKLAEGDPVANVNVAPVIDSPDAVSVPENQTFVSDVQASDDENSEGEGLSFNLSGGADLELFTIDESSGLLSFLNAPDHEAPADSNADNVYVVQVTVTDEGELTDTRDIVITVLNEPDGVSTEVDGVLSSGGLLLLQGTNGNDSIVLTGTGPGSFSVSDAASDGAPVGDFQNVTGFRLNGQLGDNSVVLQGMDIPGTLEINGGSGNDRVEIEGSLSVGGLVFDLAGGNNMITTTDENVTIEVAGSASIETNRGDDMVVIPNITTGNHFDIDLGGGNDKTVLGTAGGSVIIGNRLTLNSSYGDNQVVMEGVQVIKTVQLFSGNGTDAYEISNIDVGGFMDLISGAGNDGVVSVSNRIAGEYNVNCGPGDQDSYVSTNDQGNPSVNRQCETAP